MSWESQLSGEPLLEWTTSWLKGPAALPTALVGAWIAPLCKHHTCWSPAWTGVMLGLPHVWWRSDDGQGEWFSAACSTRAHLVIESCSLVGWLSTVAGPDESLSHPQHTWWICAWWSGPGTRWIHVLGWWGLLVVTLKPYLAAKSWYSLAVNWLPLSEMISSGILNTEKRTQEQKSHL